MPLLTLSMIVKNEESNLTQCLSSVEGVVDEIVIVDTGSGDNTKSIAKSFGAQVFDFEWVNDFSAARNFALSKSGGNWILYLDADEKLDEKSKNELSRIVSSNEKYGVNCFVESIDEYNNSPVTMSYTRLFKNNPSIKFSGKVHEQIEPSLIENGYLIIESGIKILHTGYNLPEDELKEKSKRNLQILLDEYHSKPCGYSAYQIANSYAVIKNREEASKYFITALRDSLLENEYRIISLSNLAGYELEKLNFEEAERYINEGLKLNRGDANFYFTAAQINLKKRNFNTSLNYINRAFALNNSKSSTEHKRILIKIDNYKILFLGIVISFAANNGSQLNHFCNLLDAENKEKAKFYDYEESVILKNLIANHSIEESKIDSLAYYITKQSLSAYITILEQKAAPQVTIKVLEKIKQAFNENEQIHLALGSAYIQIGDTKNGEESLHLVKNLNKENPAAYFYLISLYLNESRIEDVNEMIEEAELLFENNKMILSKLDAIKKKLKCLIS